MKSKPVVVLVDDVRNFRDARPYRIARTSEEAIALLDEYDGQRIDELWLDYDLGRGTTVEPFVTELLRRASGDRRPDIVRVFVHTTNLTGANYLMQRLTEAGYNPERHRRLKFWTR